MPAPDPTAPNSEYHPEPVGLRRLRRLITTLTVVMIGGVLVIVGVLVTRLTATGPNLPDMITLPSGEVAEAYTQGKGWIAVVTRDGDGQMRIHVLSESGTPRQTIEIEPEQ